jgi:hypothetical protein
MAKRSDHLWTGIVTAIGQRPQLAEELRLLDLQPLEGGDAAGMVLGEEESPKLR